jgi:polyisoprenoid-binding protein YceI
MPRFTCMANASASFTALVIEPRFLCGSCRQGGIVRVRTGLMPMGIVARVRRRRVGNPVSIGTLMKYAIAALTLAWMSVVTQNSWRVAQGDVRVICPMTIGGSFEAKTMALEGSVTRSASDPRALEGTLAVNLRTLNTGIGLRTEHLRANYLEVDNGPAFEMATLSGIEVEGLNLDAPEGKGSFTGLLTLHGLTRTVTGPVDIRPNHAGLRVKVTFPVQLADYQIRKPRHLGVGVKDIVYVEVAFDASLVES